LAQTTEQGGLAQRYAAALLELAEDKHAIDAVSGDLVALGQMIADSADLQTLIQSPLIQRAEQTRAITAVAQAAGLGELTQRFVGLVAANRRLFALPAIIKAFRKMLADKRGEVAAEVTAAHALTDSQKAAVSDAIKRVVGGKVTIDMKVDPGLLGGLIVRVGSRMIDGSVKTKLQKLQLAMKGVG
jgi:F-type H+-transporting ATPase subunit delta